MALGVLHGRARLGSHRRVTISTVVVKVMLTRVPSTEHRYLLSAVLMLHTLNLCSDLVLPIGQMRKLRLRTSDGSPVPRPQGSPEKEHPGPDSKPGWPAPRPEPLGTGPASASCSRELHGACGQGWLSPSPGPGGRGGKGEGGHQLRPCCPGAVGRRPPAQASHLLLQAESE